MEQLVTQEMRQDFLLVFQIDSFDEIRSEDLFGYRISYQEPEEDEVEPVSEPLSPETLRRMSQTLWRFNTFLKQPMQRRTAHGRDGRS